MTRITPGGSWLNKRTTGSEQFKEAAFRIATENRKYLPAGDGPGDNLSNPPPR
jgi:hypothetical protein